MKEYLFKLLGIKGAISTKKARKVTHSSNYELKFTRNHALKLIAHLSCYHPKKKHRIKTALKYYRAVTIRNGKYNERALARKAAFERLFHWSIR